VKAFALTRCFPGSSLFVFFAPALPLTGLGCLFFLFLFPLVVRSGSAAFAIVAGLSSRAFLFFPLGVRLVSPHLGVFLRRFVVFPFGLFSGCHCERSSRAACGFWCLRCFGWSSTYVMLALAVAPVRPFPLPLIAFLALGSVGLVGFPAFRIGVYAFFLRLAPVVSSLVARGCCVFSWLLFVACHGGPVFSLPASLFGVRFPGVELISAVPLRFVCPSFIQPPPLPWPSFLVRSARRLAGLPLSLSLFLLRFLPLACLGPLCAFGPVAFAGRVRARVFFFLGELFSLFPRGSSRGAAVSQAFHFWLLSRWAFLKLFALDFSLLGPFFSLFCLSAYFRLVRSFGLCRCATFWFFFGSGVAAPVALCLCFFRCLRCCCALLAAGLPFGFVLERDSFCGGGRCRVGLGDYRLAALFRVAFGFRVSRLFFSAACFRLAFG